MKNYPRTLRNAVACLLCALMFFSITGCGSEKQPASALDPGKPVTVTVWNYYNGDQLAAFDQLVNDFNSSIGAEKGIVVVNVSQGDIGTLADSLLSSVAGDAGAQETPSIAAVYAETAFILDKAGALAPLDPYFTQEELADYVPGFIEEGRFNENNELLLFPILKSTELFTANMTDWEPFAEATGITLESITTKEELTAAAEEYYNWTDSLTPEIQDDGRALYGRDSVSNYVYIGTYQLGHEMFSIEKGQLTVDLDKDSFRTLWDNYYIPFVNGYFGAYAKFRSEDCKTGKILALTSSSSSVSYLPTAVTLEDDSTHDIETYAVIDLPFADAVNDAAVQQGASYCLLTSTPAQQEGAVEFMKWFTEPERNLSFAMMSGYSPVTMEANDADTIKEAYGEISSKKQQNIISSLLINAETFNAKETYAVKPFEGSKEVRTILGDMYELTAQTDRAAVLEAMAAGATREEAVAQYVSDEYFDSFFETLTEQVNGAMAG